MMRLFLLGFILSACASGRLKYMNTNGHTVGKKQDTEVTVTQKRSNAQPIDSLVTAEEEEETLQSEVMSSPEEKVRVSDRLFDQLKEKDPDTYEQFQTVYSRIDKKNTVDASADEDEEERTTGNILLILALILAIISVLFIFKSNNVSTADSSPEGCLFALASVAVFAMFALLFGIAAIVLLIIGLVVIAVSRSEHSQSEQ